MSEQGRAEVVVVTGASGGVGRAVAHAFATRGARVGLVARGEEGLEGARQEVESFGGEALVLPTDVADHEQVGAAAEAVEQQLGPIDVWVNDAMATVFAPFAKVTPEEFKRATEVTYLGAVYGTMSALRRNTPQFNWCRTRLPDHPQPVPPIFQPEVPAEAVYWAAHHRRRELDVGGSAVKAIFGNKLAPRFADSYLARTGYRSQQIQDMPVDGRPDNLFEPVPEQAATHGMFDKQAHDHSYQLWANTHRPLVAGALAGTAAAAIGLARAVR